jgi:dihydrofolate reductase
VKPVPEPLGMIAAVGKGGVIGKAGQVPWRIPEDLKHFKATTLGHAIVMGRKTWDEVGKPLPGRTSVVVSRRALALPEGVIVAPDIETAIAAAHTIDPSPWIIGGGEIYRLAMPFATHLSITWVDREVEGGEAFFPKIPADFRETTRRAFDVDSAADGSEGGAVLVEYVRSS